MDNLISLNGGQQIELTERIGAGGEGEIWTTNQLNLVAKIYNAVTPEHLEKLKMMVKNPPFDPMARRGYVSIAWPKDLIKNTSNDKIVGFLMPEIKNGEPLINIYNHQSRQQQFPHLDWLHLHIIAQNLASVVESIHHKQYVIGDIKPQNLLVPVDDIYVVIVDTDSFQIRCPDTGKVYICSVGTPEYTSPELFKENIQTIHRLKSHDLFGLGVILYQILFGEHPFTGLFDQNNSKQDLSDLKSRISLGYWPYAPETKILRRELSIPLEIIHPKLQDCFKLCFTDGHKDPEKRPSARAWRRALQTAIEDLQQCSVVSSHQYDKTYGKCYWCEAYEKFEQEFDYFPLGTPSEQLIPKLPVTLSEPPSSNPPVTSRKPKYPVSLNKSTIIAVVCSLSIIVIVFLKFPIITGVCLGIILGVPYVRKNFTQPVLENLRELLKNNK